MHHLELSVPVKISNDIRDLTLDLAFRAARQHGERNPARIAAGLAEAFYRFLVIHYGAEEAKALSVAMMESQARDAQNG